MSDGNTLPVACDEGIGLAAFRRYNPDLVILDPMLPVKDGMGVLQLVRRETDIYVIMLTVKSEEFDRVKGLTVGVDDYQARQLA